MLLDSFGLHEPRAAALVASLALGLQLDERIGTSEVKQGQSSRCSPAVQRPSIGWVLAYTIVVEVGEIRHCATAKTLFGTPGSAPGPVKRVPPIVAGRWLSRTRIPGHRSALRGNLHAMLSVPRRAGR